MAKQSEHKFFLEVSLITLKYFFTDEIGLSMTSSVVQSCFPRPLMKNW
jgi:hypothetical protein